MTLYVVPVENKEELLEPFVHDFVVAPPMIELCEKNRSSLPSLVLERRQNLSRQVTFDSITVSLINFSRPVVRTELRAHIIASPTIKRKTQIISARLKRQRHHTKFPFGVLCSRVDMDILGRTELDLYFTIAIPFKLT